MSEPTKLLSGAMLIGLAHSLAPSVPNHGPPIGQVCTDCGGTQGHRDDCLHALLERMAFHIRDHPACRKVGEIVLRTENGELLCPRGRRLFEKARAVGLARDREYARTMGGLPGDPRPA